MATALIDTGSRMDEVIYEEFKVPATRSTCHEKWRSVGSPVQHQSIGHAP